MKRMIVVAITGASGVVYGDKRLLGSLKRYGYRNSRCSNLFLPKIILEYELQTGEDEIKKSCNRILPTKGLLQLQLTVDHFKFEAMIIVPCTMKTLSAIALWIRKQCCYTGCRCYIKRT